MSNVDSVSQLTGQNFSRFLLGTATRCSTSAAANVAGTVPILLGGLTNGGATSNSGGVIVRQVTFLNPDGNIGTANVAILTSSDGNTSNAVVATTKLSTLTAVGTWQDGTVASPYTTQVIPGNLTQALFVYVSATGAVAGNVDVRVYGDVVSF